MKKDPSALSRLLRRYRGATPKALEAVLCPLMIPILSLDKKIIKLAGQSHYRASFTVKLNNTNEEVMEIGRTGKFVPAAYLTGGAWREIAKGRIINVDRKKGIAYGEVYIGATGTQDKLAEALSHLRKQDFLEIDQYGAAAKVLSGLAEYELARMARSAGYVVRRMPEDMAQHLGHYANYDFVFEKKGKSQKVEVKSIWGTNTECARLIHSTTTKPKGDPSTWSATEKANYYPTSSCKFATQDIFAVSLFLRTGRIRDFAFARSVPDNKKPYGLPRCSEYPNHVSQNPRCIIGDGTWFATIDEVWGLS